MVCFWLAVAFSDDFANGFVPRSPVLPFGLELENIFEDHGVFWQVIDEMLALKVETYRRCFPAQPALSALQMYHRRKCAFLLRDLAAAANLPPHGALLSQQLLDLTHRRWTERADTDIGHQRYPSPCSRAVYIHIKLHSEGVPGPAPFQLPDPLQPACSLTDLLTAIAALLTRRQPHSAPFLHSAWTVQQVITEECRILKSVQFELGTPYQRLGLKSSRSASPCGASSASSMGRRLRARLARVPSNVLARGAQSIADVYVQNQPFTLESRPLHWELFVVPLVRVLDLSLDCRSTPETLLRWLGLFLLARASSHFPRFFKCSSAVPNLKTRDEDPLSQGNRA